MRLWHARERQGKRRPTSVPLNHGLVPSKAGVATPFPRMVSLSPLPAFAVNLAFCISGTLRLTDWKPVSQTLLVFSGTFSYLVRGILSNLLIPPHFSALLCPSNTPLPSHSPTYVDVFL